MQRRKQLLRAGFGVVVSAALILPFGAGAAADGSSSTSFGKLRPELRAHISGMVDQAISADASSTRAARPNNFFPRNDECGVRRGGNIKVNQNCLNVTDADLQGRGQAQNETAIAVDPN